ncbi:MAG: ribosome-binding factor A [Bacillota bacterium]
MQITYDGTALWATVEKRLLHLAVEGGSDSGHVYDLNNYTLSSLAVDINALPGYTADVLGSIGSLKAIALIDVDAQNLKEDSALKIFTSVLWQLFKPLSYELEQVADDFREGLRQLDIAAAEGPWIDAWGDVWGVTRVEGETDDFYSKRVIWETVKPRINNKALEDIIENAFGFTAQVDDLDGNIWITNESLTFDPSIAANMGSKGDEVHYIYGADYAQYGSFRAYVEVPQNISGFQYSKEQIQTLLNRYKAAGTVANLAIYVFFEEACQTLKKAIRKPIADITAIYSHIKDPATEVIVSPDLSSVYNRIYSGASQEQEQSIDALSLELKDFYVKWSEWLELVWVYDPVKHYWNKIRITHEEWQRVYGAIAREKNIFDILCVTTEGAKDPATEELGSIRLDATNIEAFETGTVQLERLGEVTQSPVQEVMDAVASTQENHLADILLIQNAAFMRQDFFFTNEGLTNDIYVTPYTYLSTVIDEPQQFELSVDAFDHLLGGWFITNTAGRGSNEDTPIGIEAFIQDELVYQGGSREYRTYN